MYTDIGYYNYTPFSVIIQVEEVYSLIVYDKLWDTMKQKEISQYSLVKRYGVSPAQITRLKRNESVTIHTINMLCEILDCRVEEIMEYKKE